MNGYAPVMRQVRKPWHTKRERERDKKKERERLRKQERKGRKYAPRGYAPGTKGPLPYKRPYPWWTDMRQLCAGYKNLARRARRAGQVFVSKEIKTVCNDFSQTGEGQHRVQDDRNKLHYINFGYAPTYAPYIYIYIYEKMKYFFGYAATYAPA